MEEKKKVLNRVQFITALTSCICWILYALLEGQQIVIILTGGLLIPIAIGFTQSRYLILLKIQHQSKARMNFSNIVIDV